MSLPSQLRESPSDIEGYSRKIWRTLNSSAKQRIGEILTADGIAWTIYSFYKVNRNELIGQLKARQELLESSFILNPVDLSISSLSTRESIQHYPLKIVDCLLDIGEELNIDSRSDIAIQHLFAQFLERVDKPGSHDSSYSISYDMNQHMSWHASFSTLLEESSIELISVSGDIRNVPCDLRLQEERPQNDLSNNQLYRQKYHNSPDPNKFWPPTPDNPLPTSNTCP